MDILQETSAITLQKPGAEQAGNGVTLKEIFMVLDGPSGLSSPYPPSQKNVIYFTNKYNDDKKPFVLDIL